MSFPQQYKPQRTYPVMPTLSIVKEQPCLKKSKVGSKHKALIKDAVALRMIHAGRVSM